MSKNQTPVFSGKALGYRGWYIQRDFVETESLSLRPLVVGNTKSVWVPGVNKALCFPSASSSSMCSEAPGSNCHCGYNAFSDLSEAELYASMGYIQRYKEILHPIVGSVKGFGNMQIHETGWRSEYSEIVALYDYMRENEDPCLAAHELCLKFNVPLFTNKIDFLEYSKAHGVPVQNLFKPESKLSRLRSKMSRLINPSIK